ncbi:MAG: type II secretion system minor pseudopilin GspI [Gammaproteobacteria bacterium]
MLCRRASFPGHRQGGFTLLEVLVALSIVALALAALLSATGTQTAAATHIQQRTFAQWVGLNALAEARLFPENGGGGDGSEDMAGARWAWSYQVESTPDPAVERIVVSVRLEGDGPEVAQVIGYRWREAHARQ